MKKGIIIIGIIAGILLVFFLSAGKFLVVDEAPQKADVIVVLSGDRGFRTEYGVKLYNEGYARYLILSGGKIYHNTTQAQLMKSHAMELGVPGTDIIIEDKADSTYQNALYVKEAMDRYNFKSAVVVSSNYHMRRVRMTFKRIFKNSETELIYCASEDANFKPGHWWSSGKSIMTVINEYIKLIGYWLGAAK